MKTAQPIIEPVDKQLIQQELTQERLLRETNKGGNRIYVVNNHNAPNTMREIGRLRELTFREAGGGTGKASDIDKYDTADKPYEQLIVWDPTNDEILGGYRYYVCHDLPRDSEGNISLATRGLFEFSQQFVDEFLPYTIELGRSFVQPRYQSSKAGRKGLYALDNLWDGLGALLVEYPDTRYFFGKVTMYPHFNRQARDMILYFFQRHFSDKDRLVYPVEPLDIQTSEEQLKEIMPGTSLERDYRALSKEVRKYNENIPPLISSYISLSPTMRTFGTAINPHFGYVEETGILITVEDIYLKKKHRHVESYIKGKLGM